MLKKLKKLFFQNPKGFTLMEMVVVLAVFSTTSVMAVDLFITITRVQRQTRNVQSVQSDARFALESMVREIRNGSIDYDFYKTVCQGGTQAGNSCLGEELLRYCQMGGGQCVSLNLTNSATILATRDQEDNQVFYRLKVMATGNKIEMCSSTSEDFNRCDNSNNWQIVTSSGVKITDLRFYIFPASNPFSIKNSCTQNSDCDSSSCSNYLCDIPDVQPEVTVILEAQGGSGAEQEKINMQTTSTSMVYRR